MVLPALYFLSKQASDYFDEGCVCKWQVKVKPTFHFLLHTCKLLGRTVADLSKNASDPIFGLNGKSLTGIKFSPVFHGNRLSCESKCAKSKFGKCEALRQAEHEFITFKQLAKYIMKMQKLANMGKSGAVLFFSQWCASVPTQPESLMASTPEK